MADIPNKQNTGDVTLYDESGNPINIILDGSTYRLAVDANISSGNIDTPKYRYQNIFSDSDIDFNNDNWITIVNINNEGKPYVFQAEFYDSNYDIRLTIDSEVVFEMNNSEMGNLNLNQANAFRYIKSGSIYRYSSDSVIWHFNNAEAFDTSFKIEVRRRSGNNHGLDNFFFAWGKKI